jgi:transcription initiation factor IIE alpha subunit
MCNMCLLQVRAYLARLEEEGLVRQEEMPDEFSGGRKANYWYVDYRHAVNVIRLRVHLMQKKLREQEQKELARQTYKCPQCDATFTVLEIQRLVNGARGFCCSHCCENDVHTTCVKGPHSLQDFDNRETLRAVTAEYKELKEQLGGSADEGCSRASIFDLLKVLHDKPVPSNTPSELRARGVGGRSGQHGAARLARFQDDRFSMHAVYAANQQQGAAGSAAAAASAAHYSRNVHGHEVVVEIEVNSSDEEEGGSAFRGGLPSKRTLKRKAEEDAAVAAAEVRRAKKIAPAFLRGSRISGSGHSAADDYAADAAAAAAATAAAGDSAQAAAGRVLAAAAAAEAAAAERKALFDAALAKQHAALGSSAADNEEDDDTQWEYADEANGYADNGYTGNGYTGNAAAAAAAAAAGAGASANSGVQQQQQQQYYSGIMFELLNSRTVALEDVTIDDVEAMTADQYKQYYAATATT